MKYGDHNDIVSAIKFLEENGYAEGAKYMRRNLEEEVIVAYGAPPIEPESLERVSANVADELERWVEESGGIEFGPPWVEGVIDWIKRLRAAIEAVRK
jgi:hypothetical protein